MADNVANNLANVNTSGFKQTLMQVESAQTMDIFRMQTDPGRVSGRPLPGVPVSQYVGVLGTGSQIHDTPSNFEAGPLAQTGNALDLALGGTGNAFFTIATPQGIRYTRSGEFVKDGQGYLRTGDGNAVLNTQGQQIQLQDQGAIAVGTDGTITQGGRPVSQLQITGFNSLLNLRPEGANTFAMSGNAGPGPATGAAVQQGFLEKSNANVVRSMVDLINAERWFDANEKVIKTQDDATNMAITQVAKTQ
ncbi:MAG: flagellar hook-basal body complex protein [Candidatus Eremiobacteraeota bacterium]|nr:flagellar hook-basal body complex protein [Candidatus Eremiobacteraeota bacterium]